MDDLLDYQVAPNGNNNRRRFIGVFFKKLIIVARYRPAAGQYSWLLTVGNAAFEKRNGSALSSFFLGGQFCGVAPSGDHPQEDLTKFGYKLNMKLEFF